MESRMNTYYRRLVLQVLLSLCFLSSEVSAQAFSVNLILPNSSLVPGDKGRYSVVLDSNANITCLLEYGDIKCSTVLTTDCSLTTNNQIYYVTEYAYTTTGEFTLTVFCENDIGNASDHAVMSIQYPIDGFMVSTDSVTLEEKDGSIIGEVQFSYQNGTSARADCGILGVADCSQTTTLNSDSMNGTISFLPSYFPAIGEYTLTLRLENNVSYSTVNISLILLEKIQGLTLDIPDVVLVNATILAQASVTSGSSIEFFWLTGATNIDQMWFLCSENNATRTISYKFSDLGQTVFEVEAFNGISEAVATKSVSVVMPVEGFSATTSSDLPGADLELRTSSTFAEHMGNLTVLITSNGYSFHNTTIKPTTTGETYSIYQNLPQGNHNLNITVTSGVSQQELFLTAALWNWIAVELQVENVDIETGSLFTIELLNTSGWGYVYTYDFGDSGVNSSEEIDELSELRSTNKLLQHSYLTDGIYTFTVEVSNPKYRQDLNVGVTFNVFHPVPEFDFRASPVVKIPPNDLWYAVDFPSTLPTMPTNGSCVVHQLPQIGNDMTSFNYSWDQFINGNRTGLFPSDGLYNVTVRCFNKVSYVSKWKIVRAFEITGERFNVSYDYYQGLNDTEDSVEVTYTVTYYDNTYMPQLVELLWDFDDGSSQERLNLTSWTMTHLFSRRGVFNSTLQILIPDEEAWPINMPIQIGILMVTPSTFAGKVNEDMMTVTIEGAVGDLVDYVIDFGDGNVAISDGTEVGGAFITRNIYTTAGLYQVKITASNNLFVEEKLINNVQILWPVQGLTLEVEQEIKVPDGEGLISIFSDGTSQIPTNMSCVIKYSDNSATDLIDGTGQIRHRFTNLGEIDVMATCNNSVTSMELSNSTTLKSTCFGPLTPFNHYSGDLIKLISEKLTLSAVIDVLCTNMTLQFTWNALKDDIPVPLDQPDTTVLTIHPRQLQAGTYTITFRASFLEFPAIYLSDSIIVTYSKSDIVAVISGGSVRTVGTLQKTVLNGFTQSYDPDSGPDLAQGLTFNWACEKASTINEAETVIISGSSSPCPNCVTDKHTGIINIQPGCLAINTWHVFILTVTKDTRSSKATNILHVVREPSPQILLSCRLNCLSRKNAEFSVQYESTCSDCTPEDLAEAVYEWQLYQRPDPSGVENLVPDFHLLTNTGVNIAALSILPDSLLAGYMYRLELQISNITDKSVGSVSEIFQINYPPYAGSCSVSPSEGRSVLDPFIISCAGWVDEDSRFVRSLQDTGDRLNYQFLLYEEEGDNSLIYSGESRISPPTELNVGKKEDGYKRRIIIRVFDAYNGMVESSIEATVLSPVQEEKEVHSLANVSSVLEDFDSKVNDSVKNGNVQQSSRLIESAASVIQTLKLPEDETLIPEEADTWLSLQPVDVGLENETAVPWTELWEDWNTPHDTELQDHLTQETSVYIDAMVRLENNTAENSVDNVFYVSSTIGNLLKKPNYVSDNGLVAAVNCIDRVTAPLEALIAAGTDDRRVKEVLTSVMSSLDTMIGVTLPEFRAGSGAVDVATVLQETKLEQSYAGEESQLVGNEAKEGADLQDEERAFFRTRQYITQQYKNKKKQQLAKSVLSPILRTVDKAMNAAHVLLVVGQEPIEFSNPKLTASVQKLTMNDYVMRTSHRGGASLSLEDVPDFGGENPTVIFKTTVFTKTPFVWDEDGESSAITSNSITLDLTASDPHGLDNFTNYEIKLKLSVPNSEPVPSTIVTPKFIRLDRDQLLYHKLELRSTDDSILLFLTSTIPYVKYDVYFRSGEFPTSKDFDYKTSIPPTRTSFGLPKLKVMCPGGSLPTRGPVFVALKPYKEELKGRQKRETSYHHSSANESSDYGFGVGTVGCRVWNDAQSKWNSDMCTVSVESSENETVCSCKKLLTQPFTLATSFVVPVNKIDFSTVFAKIDVKNNASVLATILSLIIVYILLAVWARHRDCSDFLKWGVTPLIDNKSVDQYVYIVTVTTGMRPGAGTKSKVGMSLSGTEHESMNRVLYDGIRDEFPTRSVLNFLLVEPYPLGDLEYIRVWHDDSGAGDAASWFLQNITIEDMQTDIRYTFLCDRWLAVDKDDGKIERIVPSSGKSDLVTFAHLFNNNIRQNVTDSHIWLSVLMRPTQSHFTRLQRLSCCLSLLFLTMIASSMFYQAEEDIVRPTLITVGSLRFSLQQLYVSFISILIVTPVNLLLVLLFKKTKPDDRRKPSILDRKCFSRCFPGADKRAKLAEVMITRKTYDVKERMLPHYFIYLIWGILFVSVALSAFFLFLYSQQWGKTKSEEWLTSFLLSFFESLIFMDPIKVVLITVLLSLLFRNTDKDDTSLDKKQLQTQKKYVVDGDENEIPSCPTSPLNEEAVKKSQTIRRDESTAFGIAQEVTFYVIFLMVLFTIGYSNRDTRSFAMKENVFNALVRKQSDKRIGLENIRSREHFFRWVNETAFPVLFAENYYEGSRRHWRERYFVQDLQNYRVGPPRFRQLRNEAGKSCYIDQLGKMPCAGAYSILGEETRDFCIGWKDPPCPDTEPIDYFTSAAWKFTSSLDIWGLPIWGQYNTYGGGGYISELDVNYQVSSVMLREEFKHLWLDTLTRAVNLEFTLYNPNVNMFVFVSLLVEFPETGGAIPKAFVLPFRAYHLVGALGMYILINQVLFLIFIIFATIKLISTIKKQKVLFFRDHWNALDFACLVTCYVCIGMFYLKEYMVGMALEKFHDNPKKFVNFQHITVWDDCMVCLIGLVCFFCTIRMIKILGYNKRISSISSVIKRASGDLVSFSFLFAILFIGFTLLGYLLFGRNLTAYSGMLKTAATLMTSMIGKTPFDEMRRTEPILAQIYFGFFIFFVVYILLTMFMSILNETITQIHREDCADTERHHVFDILLAKFKESLGFSTKKPSSVERPTVSQDLPLSAAARKMRNDSEFALKVLEVKLDKYHPLINVDSDGYSTSSSKVDWPPKGK